MKISLVFILFVVVQAKDFIIHRKQFVLNQGLILGTLDVLRKEHTIIFKVYPKSYSKGWKSVFHLTQGKDYGAYGDRIPGVWFHDDGSGKLSIFTAVNGNNNYYVATAPLPLNQWSSVKICQSVHNGKYWYSVDLNGINIHRVENSDARDFQNIIVYASDPWYAAQNALISNIIIVNGNIETIIGSVPANLVKGKLIAEIPKLDKEYLVSFDIYPNKFVAGWHSVIHFSIGSDYGRYGDRTPGIWFHTDGKGGLYISAPINGNVDRVFTTNPIGLNRWSSVEVSQFLRNSVYIYTIRINEEIVFSEINNLAQSFDNVKVYASDPWYDAQYGSIRSLFVVNGVSNNGLQAVIVLPTDFIDDASKIVVKKNFLIATLLILKKQFSVSFEVKPTLYQTAWHSVFHMTIGQDIENYGDRIPGVWFHDDGSGKLLIAFAINGNKNYYFTTASSLPLNQWSKIEISQRLDSFIYVYEVSLNGVVIFTIQNNDARDFKNVKVYLGDPWYSAQAGSVKNLKIFNKI